MTEWDAEAFDRWLTTQPEDDETLVTICDDNSPEAYTKIPYSEWAGRFDEFDARQETLAASDENIDDREMGD